MKKNKLFKTVFSISISSLLIAGGVFAAINWIDTSQNATDMSIPTTETSRPLTSNLWNTLIDKVGPITTTTDDLTISKKVKLANLGISETRILDTDPGNIIATKEYVDKKCSGSTGTSAPELVTLDSSQNVDSLKVPAGSTKMDLTVSIWNTLITKIGFITTDINYVNIGKKLHIINSLYSSVSTSSTDSATTLVTKDYVDKMCPKVIVPLVKENGVCNNSVALGCTKGTLKPTDLSYNQNCGEYRTWYCLGLNGGNDSTLCTIQNTPCVSTPVDGVCGSKGTCGPGVLAQNSYIPGSCLGNATWTCNGYNGGKSTNCSEYNGDCGGTGGGNQPICGPKAAVASNDPFTVNYRESEINTFTKNDKCSWTARDIPITSGDNFNLSGKPYWQWDCVTSNNGVEVGLAGGCRAGKIVDGWCGATKNSCDKGTFITGGAWGYTEGTCGTTAWTCLGINGGDDKTCEIVDNSGCIQQKCGTLNGTYLPADFVGPFPTGSFCTNSNSTPVYSYIYTSNGHHGWTYNCANEGGCIIYQTERTSMCGGSMPVANAHPINGSVGAYVEYASNNGATWSADPGVVKTTTWTYGGDYACGFECNPGSTYNSSNNTCGVNCTYTTIEGSCNASCGGGQYDYYYTITSPAIGGSCAVSEGQYAWSSGSCNTQDCPKTLHCNITNIGPLEWNVGCGSCNGGGPACYEIGHNGNTALSCFTHNSSSCGTGTNQAYGTVNSVCTCYYR